MTKPSKFWDKVAQKSKPEPDQSAAKVIELTKRYLGEDYLVLDVGCGSGVITQALSENAQLIEAIDLSEGMLEVAKKRAKASSISNIHYTQTSIFDERFTENSFDAILSFNVLHYIEDLAALMDRVNSLLKPNGLFISSTACLKEKTTGIRALMWTLSKLSLIPNTIFYTKAELENHIVTGHFAIVRSDTISNIPEYFLVGEKSN